MHTQSTLDAFATTRAALAREELFGVFRARPMDMAAMTPTAPTGAPVGARDPLSRESAMANHSFRVFGR